MNVFDGHGLEPFFGDLRLVVARRKEWDQISSVGLSCCSAGLSGRAADDSDGHAWHDTGARVGNSSLQSHGSGSLREERAAKTEQKREEHRADAIEDPASGIVRSRAATAVRR